MATSGLRALPTCPEHHILLLVREAPWCLLASHLALGNLGKVISKSEVHHLMPRRMAARKKTALFTTPKTQK